MDIKLASISQSRFVPDLYEAKVLIEDQKVGGVDFNVRTNAITIYPIALHLQLARKYNLGSFDRISSLMRELFEQNGVTFTPRNKC